MTRTEATDVGALRVDSRESVAPHSTNYDDRVTAVRSQANGPTEHVDAIMARLVGLAPSFRKIISKLPALAKADATVLISGETGTGKELVARAIHDLGPRASHPFVAVNCGTLVDPLFEDELFGHERGAYTDARSRRQGLIAQANGGTLLLDEAETLTPHAQIALLRVLQEQTYRPLGSSSEMRADIRFMASTNAGLAGLVRRGQFRADLFYRLCVFSITLPPLRERREDILPLAAHFLGKHSPHGRPVPGFSTAASAALQSFDWPGNVRELESAAMRGLSLASGRLIEREDLGLPGPHLLPPASESTAGYKAEKQRVVDAFEHEYLVRIMTEHHGNVSRAARAAGKERRALGKLLKRCGVDPKQFAG